MDAIQQVAVKKLKAIKQLTNNSNTGNIKFLLKGKDINSLSPETDFVLINKIFDTIKPKQTDIKERISNIVNEILGKDRCPKRNCN